MGFISTFEPLKEYSPLGLNLYLLSSQLYLFLDVMSGCLFPSDIHYTFSNFCTVGMYLCFATDFFFSLTAFRGYNNFILLVVALLPQHIFPCTNCFLYLLCTFKLF